MPTNDGVPDDVTERWKTLIAEVRKKYTGKLLYSVSAAGDGLGPSKIKFWDALDYIGFEPYFGFSNVASPPISDLEAAFNKKLDELAWPLYNEYKKPIIFSEANCYSHAGIGTGRLLRSSLQVDRSQGLDRGRLLVGMVPGFDRKRG